LEVELQGSWASAYTLNSTMSRPNGVHVYYFPSQATHALFGKTIASFIIFLTLTVKCETKLGIFKYIMFLTVYSIYQRQYEKHTNDHSKQYIIDVK
jgi:hypothetical protein